MRRSFAEALLIASIVVANLACASAPTPKALPPQTMAPTPPEGQEEPITNASESLRPQAGADAEPLTTGIEIVEETPSASTTRSTRTPTDGDNDITVVLDSGEEAAEQPQSLFAASQAEKERRQEAGDATIVLTNKTLKNYSKGQLTFVEGEPSEVEHEPDSTGVPLAAEGDEEYWRDRVLGIRVEWRESLDQIAELESDVARLRNDFYAEDDPFYRDSQIKPAWDQALIDLEQVKRDARQSELELEQAIEEGRRAGALPGWLREGIELEPTEEELEELLPQPGEEGIHEPSEPVILDENGDGG